MKKRRTKTIQFVIVLLCMFLGTIIRIIYCIRYPVQPRDAYNYSLLISELNKDGVITEKIGFFPLSLYLLRIPSHLFDYDVTKGAVLVNFILGILIIYIVTTKAYSFSNNTLITILTGLIVATHPALVSFSCTALRENTYLFFSLLMILALISYFQKYSISSLLGISIFGALAFLCRLEGIEIIFIFILALIPFHLSKKRIGVFVKHSLIFFIVYACTSFVTSYVLGFELNVRRELFRKVNMDDNIIISKYVDSD